MLCVIVLCCFVLCVALHIVLCYMVVSCVVTCTCIMLNSEHYAVLQCAQLYFVKMVDCLTMYNCAHSIEYFNVLQYLIKTSHSNLYF